MSLHAGSLRAGHAAELDSAFRSLHPTERLQLLRAEIPGELVFTTSFGLEDQVLLHLIAGSGVPVSVVTLDTGRLFPETYDVWARSERRYGIGIRPFYPQAGALEALVAAQGINGFYASKAARMTCCGVRKLEPLGRALHGASGWITGLRADQSAARSQMTFVSWDAERALLKANPLLDWSRERIAAFAQDEIVPINPLHKQGYASIGCAPCTRAIGPGEPERAGRWWWEQDGSQECGLHLSADGRLVRARS
jgi:phosphoadenosine phosphosulfate reductase